jgi:hypothetical protein
MGSGRYRWGSVISLVLSLASPLRAEQIAGESAEPESISLAYEAAEHCPTRAVFFEQVKAYASRVELADDQVARRRFKVRVTRAGSQFTGTLEILTESETARREVTAATCAEVSDALALAAALAVDPSLMGAPLSEPSVVLPPPPHPPASAPAPEPPPTPAPKPSVASPSEAHREPEPPRRRDTSPAISPSLGVDLEGLGIWGLLPDGAYGVGFHVEYAASTARRWLPDVALGAFYVDGGASVKHGATVNFTAFAGEARSCWNLGVQRQFHFDACPLLQVGKLMSELEQHVSAQSGSRNWAAFGLSGRVRLELDDSLSLQFQSALLTHLVHQEIVVLVVEPDGSVEEVMAHETRGVMAAFTAGVAYRF